MLRSKESTWRKVMKKFFFSVTPALGTIGGSEIYLKKFINFLIKRPEIEKITIAKPDIHVLRDFFSDICSQKIEFFNYRYDNLTFDKDFFSFKLQKIIRKEKDRLKEKIISENYDVIFAHSSTDILILSDFIGKISIFFYNTPPFYARIFPVNYLLRSYMNRIGKIICVSNFIEKSVAKLKGNTNNLYVVYNGIEFDFKALVPPKKIERLGVVARFEKDKNVALAVKVFEKLSGKYPYLSLHLFEDGSQRVKLEKLIQKHMISNVFFHGFVKEINSIYSDIDLLIVPSKMEAFSLVIVEAMTMGIPAVASEVGGIPEIIKDGYNGFLSKPNVDEFVKKISQIIENPLIMEKIVSNFEETLSKYEINDKFNKIYKIILNEKNSILD